jgi:hypothetical protein
MEVMKRLPVFSRFSCSFVNVVCERGFCNIFIIFHDIKRKINVKQSGLLIEQARDPILEFWPKGEK